MGDAAQAASGLADRREPWANEPPVAHRDDDAAERLQTARAEYCTHFRPVTAPDAEQMLVSAQYDYEIACEDLIAASLVYIDVEKQQSRVRQDVIEKLMSNTDEGNARKTSASKKEDGSLSYTMADKMASAHPDYVAIRDQVAEALSVKTDAEKRCELLLHRMLNLRAIFESRTRMPYLVVDERGGIRPLGASDLPLSQSEREVVAARDSRGLDAREIRQGGQGEYRRDSIRHGRMPVGAAAREDSRAESAQVPDDRDDDDRLRGG